LRVDGGMVRSNTLLQFQADILDTPVVRPVVTETTALGAAYAAGLATGFWSGQDELRAHWQADRRFAPNMATDTRCGLLSDWARAVDRALGWEVTA
jgi:glycerol kinase